MPSTKVGKDVLKQMMKKYGNVKGKEVYFASIVKGNLGSSDWEEKGKTGKLEKAKNTYRKKWKMTDTGRMKA